MISSSKRTTSKSSSSSEIWAGTLVATACGVITGRVADNFDAAAVLPFASTAALVASAAVAVVQGHQPQNIDSLVCVIVLRIALVAQVLVFWL